MIPSIINFRILLFFLSMSPDGLYVSLFSFVLFYFLNSMESVFIYNLVTKNLSLTSFITFKSVTKDFYYNNKWTEHNKNKYIRNNFNFTTNHNFDIICSHLSEIFLPSKVVHTSNFLLSNQLVSWPHSQQFWEMPTSGWTFFFYFI